ncbi:Protein of unknown function [Flavobacteriaceae bacterium MAR_2010_188]|nr:Protein of unknown function [Flavobacteriaceae bacterium MAR_2010_188]
MEEQLTNCANCEKPYNPSYNFCPHCGQKTDEKITLKNLFYNTITNYFSFDARFFKSFIPLLFRPGYLPKKFVEGKRLLYLHPAQMYLFVSVIFFFLFSFIQREQVEGINKEWGLDKDSKLFREKSSTNSDDDGLLNIQDSIKKNNFVVAVTEQGTIDSLSRDISQNSEKYGLTKKQGEGLDSLLTKTKKGKNTGMKLFNISEDAVDSLIQAGATDNEIYKYVGMPDDAGFFTRKFYAQVLKFMKNKDLGSVLRTFYDAIPISMFLLLPLFSLLVYLFYIGKGRFTHHLIFSFYYFSFLFAVFAIMVGLNLIFDIPGWVDSLIIFSTFFYLFAALKNFYQQGWFLTFFKTGFLSFLFLMIVLPLSALLVFVYSLLFF